MSDPNGLSSPARVSPAWALVYASKKGVSVALPALLVFVLRVGFDLNALEIAGLVLVGILILGLLVGVGVLEWYFLTYQYGDGQLRIRRGVLNRQQTLVPGSRVHGFDTAAGPVERVLGLVELRIQTAGGGSEPEVRLGGLTLEEVERVRLALLGPGEGVEQEATGGGLVEETFAFRGVLGGERADVGAASYTCRLTWREIVLSSLSGRTLVLTAAGFGAILSFLDDFGLAEKAAGLIGTLGVVAVIAIVVVSILIGWTISLAIEVVRLGGFTVRRRGTRIEIERGLVEHKTTGFGVRRIQAVRINEGLIRRQFGYAELLAITAGSGTSAGDQQNAVTPLHPFIRRDQVGEFLRQVAPELPQPADVEPLPRRGAWRWAAGPVIAMLGVVAGIAATRWMFGLLEADVAVTWATWALVLAALFVPLTIPLSLWSFRSAGFGLHQRAATVRSGAITRSTWVVPRERLQWASTSIGPIQRRQRLASITLAVASSGSGTTITAPSMDAESADSAIGELQDALEKRRQGA